ncbi:glycoside hydrolase family 127 protein [Sphingomonas sp. 2R-10]|uniref:glycoside hydrolase family 127 protein n=1 Tax=Sphingomonas sp. 2R-10 TaxID=3045148 RepID=UPI000F7B85F3|nr:glycoside hydrolase family 127 protein [Sphingomonas sp. 2R-10]MDJ0276447.1 glycoside hydrolase family 127 protein [Sphingomonas sp. 2R-10]
MRPTRRELLAGSAALLLARPVVAATGPSVGLRAAPVPMRHVRLKPSPFADAFDANRRYLLSLDPDRLLHNFYVSAGMPAPEPVYGGWEAQGIAGHSLGHWLSACSLVVANTGDRAIAARLDHALAQLSRIQAAHGDGYIGGTTVERDGKTVDGKIVFEEVRRGDIRTMGFDLNGGWVPLYTWHKVQAGLTDAHLLARNPRAMPVLLAMATYLAGVLEPLTDAQMQQVLRAEHGGLNESFAELHAITGNPRWLRLAEKIRHKAVLDPLTAGVDRLEGLHANTQIPKVIGLARLHELTGRADHAAAARFFHARVTGHHSYVIGGNSEREHFGAPDKLAARVTEATCEACNSYNMMKLTRHLYGWRPDARWFDYYERVQLNHILAHQRPDTGQFVYFMPLASGARRSHSSPEDSFWCCVGSGMESHAKHADSIFWHDAAVAGGTLYVNLYIPSRLDWPDRELSLDLDTAMPLEGRATLTVRRAPRRVQRIALRLPGWAKGASVAINDRPVAVVAERGYAMLDRRWTSGDRIAISLPMRVTAEPLPDDPATVAFLHGPLVLAADLGAADAPFDGIGPALVATGATTAAITPVGPALFRAKGALGEGLSLRPFFAQHDRRTAVYFPTFSPTGWATARDGYLARAEEARVLARRTIDVFHLGEMQPERDHGFTATRSEVVNWAGRPGRRLRLGDRIEFEMTRRDGPAVLRVTVVAEDADRPMAITVDGQPVAQVARHVREGERYALLDYAIPSAGGQGRPRASVSITADRHPTVVYEVRMLADREAAPVA